MAGNEPFSLSFSPGRLALKLDEQIKYRFFASALVHWPVAIELFHQFFVFI